MTPPLVPAPSPANSPAAPLSSPPPVLPSSPPPARIAHNWSTDEVERVVGSAFVADLRRKLLFGREDTGCYACLPQPALNWRELVGQTAWDAAEQLLEC